jgi:D-alanyl-D-alanine carboxypeptidase
VAPNSFSSFDDVPEAQRDRYPVASSTAPWRVPRWLRWLLVGILSLGLTLWAALAAYQPAPTTAIAFVPAGSGFVTPPATPGLSQGKQMLGHRAYDVAPITDLVSLPSAPEIQLLPAAANAVERMVADAQAEGIALLPLSGFRSVEDQTYLFFNIKAQRGESPTARAEVSAPPGYSEHHTGYAVDFGDGTRPDTHVEITFETTPAFAWLQQQASRYNLEMSFPPDNPQNIQYEPWHWRFVGDTASLETFYQDR